MENEYREIYIIMSQTGTILSRIIKAITHKTYSHASITPYEDLHVMYSFGRLNPYNPFFGGFVEESASFGTFKRFSNTDACVISLKLPEEKYESICKSLEDMLTEPKSYHYNYLGLYLAAVNIPFKSKDRYYCSEFVRDILIEHEVDGAEGLSEIIHPSHFSTLPNTQTVYVGKLKDFELKKEAVCS